MAKRKKREIHGHAKRGSRAAEYDIWAAMIRRCKNPIGNNQSYAGVSVCDRWRNSFVAFLEDIGPRPSHNHSIDRINGSLGYSPDNCRWATASVQSLNRRGALIDDDGTHLKDIADAIGIGYGTMRDRFANGDRGAVIRRPLDDHAVRSAKNPRTKLTSDDVERIRSVYASGQCTQAALAKQFGVNQRYISLIIARSRWAHVGAEQSESETSR